MGIARLDPFDTPFLNRVTDPSGITPHGSLSVKEERQMSLRHFGDNFILVIPVDYREHTSEHPFCWNQTCPCHEDSKAISTINQAVQDGLMTPEEATDFVLGKLI